MEITSRQAEYLEYMRRFFKENDQLPPIAILADGMGVHPNAAQEAVKRLAASRVIKKNSVGKWMFSRPS